MIFQNLDVVPLAHLRFQGGLNGLAGGVGGVNDPTVAVTAFAGEVVDLAAVFLGKATEIHAVSDQSLNGGGAALHHEAHGVFAAKPGAGIDGVLNMGVEAVLVVQHRGDPALGVIGGAFA